ncbi:MAG: hypothetical protein JSU74_05050, partial [Candidatus Zixiibacteriota bacterium]
MKKTSVLFISLSLCLGLLIGPHQAAAGIGDGTVVSTTKIQDNGPDNTKFNIVIMGDGYLSSELPTFETQAQAVVTAFNNQIVYGSCGSAVNFYRVNIASDESGVDKPSPCYSPAVLVDTYLDCYYCASGTQRCIWSANTALVSATAASATIHWNFVVVLVNDTEYGGCAGSSLTFNSTGSGFENIVMHELGHALGGLGDEYEEFSNTYTLPTHSSPNLTAATNRADVEWFDLILPTTPVPTWEKTNCNVFETPPASLDGIVGTFEGGSRSYTCGVYRPQTTCLMRSLSQPFCAVCERRVKQVMAVYHAESNLHIEPWGWFKDPKVTPYWQSPDIWCDNNGNNIQEVDEPSIGKSDNHLFARIQNIGGAPSDPFDVTFSYVPYTGVIDMANRQPIQTISRPSLGAGSTDIVEVLWDLTNIPPQFSGVDHFCVI